MTEQGQTIGTPEASGRQRANFGEQAERARDAARDLATRRRADKDAALQAMAAALLDQAGEILSANAADVSAALDARIPDAQVDRLRLDQGRLEAMAQGLRQVADLADPVGEVVRGWNNPNGVQVRQLRTPFGVVAIIYEARPNVTADAAGICVKSGNAVLLRGSSSAAQSNIAITEALRAGLAEAGLPSDAVQLVLGGREVTGELMAARGQVDVLIPRGGAGLINAVVQGAKVPVIETGTGNCHLYVDAAADLEMAVEVLRNAKAQRPSVCNAAETVLVHSAVAAAFVPQALRMLAEEGVRVHGDRRFVEAAGDGAAGATAGSIAPVQESDFESEWLSLDLSAAIVDSLDQALAHVRRYSTGHTETIITDDRRAADRWIAEVDAAAVLVNASSRFVDGSEFGFGAEIGISTQKLHARGPMGLPEMTSTKYVVTGDGQVRG